MKPYSNNSDIAQQQIIDEILSEDTTFALRDGHYARVNGRTFGPWPDHGAALAGLQTEQRRAAARKEKS